VANLGLASDSILRYEVGEISRTVHDRNPELLPYGYLIGDVNSIRIVLKHGEESGGVDALAFETLTPKAIMQRYVTLLQEHRRVILCGPSGTGKTHLAERLAAFLCRCSGRQSRPLTRHTFKMGRGRQEAFVHFLKGLSPPSQEQGPPPGLLLVLDNLHLVHDLDEVLSRHLPGGPDAGPLIIGTMIQAGGAAASTNLQLRHNFRWILCANHMEPVRGLLGRHLRRKLLAVEAETRTHNGDSARIVEWMAHVAAGLNKFLESHAGPEATLGPATFMACPLEAAGETTKLWFINLWNLSLVPHLLDAVREGLQLYGRRLDWEDPAQLVVDSWPWPHAAADIDSLVHIRPEDVGFDTTPAAPRPLSGVAIGEGGGVTDDPLFNMLMTLQEAANTESGDL
jgi:neuron navigator 2